MRYGKKEMTQQEEIIQYCKNYKKDVKIEEGYRLGLFDITFPTNRRGQVSTELFVDLIHKQIFVNRDSVEGKKVGDVIAWFFNLRLIFYDPEEV